MYKVIPNETALEIKFVSIRPVHGKNTVSVVSVQSTFTSVGCLSNRFVISILVDIKDEITIRELVQLLAEQIERVDNEAIQ